MVTENVCHFYLLSGSTLSTQLAGEQTVLGNYKLLHETKRAVTYCGSHTATTSKLSAVRLSLTLADCQKQKGKRKEKEMNGTKERKSKENQRINRVKKVESTERKK
jgi:hypothetical protein